MKPIISCIYDRNYLDKETQYFLDNFKKDADFVNFSYREKDVEENGMYNFGDDTYIISLLNEKNKFSLAYLNCTGVIGVGIDKETGKNISFLSHQDPESFLEKDDVKSSLKKDLSKSLRQLVSECIPGSIDVIIFGGNKEDLYKNIPDEDFRMGIDDADVFLKNPFDNYIKSVKYLSSIIKEEVSFSPIVISGPNDNFETSNHSLNVYFDNEKRRLYMVKPKQEKSDKNEAFEAPNVEEQIKKF